MNILVIQGSFLAHCVRNNIGTPAESGILAEMFTRFRISQSTEIPAAASAPGSP